MAKFYAIKKGRKTGIFKTWEECKENTVNFSGAIFKSFKTEKEALEYLGIEIEKNNYEKEKKTHKYHVDEEDIFKSISEGEMIAYIDGSYDDSKKYFAYAGIMFYNNMSEEFAYADNEEDLISMRNVSGEVKASVYAIKKAVEYKLKKITIYYDYIGIENWAKGTWKTNNALTKSYREFCKEISQKIDIDFVKIKSHTNIKFNEHVDKLAKKAIEDVIF